MCLHSWKMLEKCDSGYYYYCCGDNYIRSSRTLEDFYSIKIQPEPTHSEVCSCQCRTHCIGGPSIYCFHAGYSIKITLFYHASTYHHTQISNLISHIQFKCSICSLVWCRAKRKTMAKGLWKKRVKQKICNCNFINKSKYIQRKKETARNWPGHFESCHPPKCYFPPRKPIFLKI